MNIESATHAVFATPELLLLVSKHLTTPDLARCNLVCKDWSRQFEPILWTTFYLRFDDASLMNYTPTLPLKLALIRNLPHIRVLDLFSVDDTFLQLLLGRLVPLSDDTNLGPSIPCLNVRRLKVGLIKHDRLAPTSLHLATLLSLNRHLTHLDLPYDFLKSSGVLAALSNLSHLQHLTIHSSEGAAACRETLLLLKACLPLPELSEMVFLDMNLNWDEVDESKDKDMPDAETIIAEASIARFSQCPTATKITSLRLPSGRKGTRNPLPLLLLKSGLLDLESCEIPWIRNDADIQEIEQIVRKHCPRLKHLLCPLFRGGGHHNGETIRAFIRGCSGLRSFSSKYFTDSDMDSFDAFYVDHTFYDCFVPRLIIPEMVRHHWNTLEVFDLTGSMKVFSTDQQNVLSRCRQLKRFWVTSSPREGSMVGIECQDICKNDWVCSELRELSLVLDLHPREKRAIDSLKTKLEGYKGFKWDEWDEPDDLDMLLTVAADRVYAQIGGLRKLEVLALDVDRSIENMATDDELDFEYNLTCSSGFLCQLAGLKNLRSLELKVDFWSAMGQAEVEFIYTNWPLLSEITFRGDISQLRALPHWQWLLRKRPQLRLEGGEE